MSISNEVKEEILKMSSKKYAPYFLWGTSSEETSIGKPIMELAVVQTLFNELGDSCPYMGLKNSDDPPDCIAHEKNNNENKIAIEVTELVDEKTRGMFEQAKKKEIRVLWQDDIEYLLCTALPNCIRKKESIKLTEGSYTQKILVIHTDVTCPGIFIPK